MLRDDSNNGSSRRPGPRNVLGEPCPLWGAARMASHCLNAIRQKILMFGILGKFLDGSTSPSKSSTACRASGIFGENFGQRIRKLAIKCRNVGAANYALIPFRRALFIIIRAR